ncbi:MAG: hypothetical protein KTR30_11035 [Saprospiraceae bacterium]|nr:hypothetical protein [Saprospiraceae bacterium]
MKTNILLLVLGLLAFTAKAQTKALTPKHCAQQYMSWKNGSRGGKPDDLFHRQFELHWMEGDEWHKKNGRDYIQKIQAGHFLDRQQEILSLHTEKKTALVRLRETFPSDGLVATETLKLERHKGHWQITEILIIYHTIEHFTTETHFTQN